MRAPLRRFVLLLSLMLAFANPSDAIVGVSIATVDASASLDSLTIGDTIDLGIVVEADPTRGGVVALGTQAYGFDPSVAQSISVTTAPEFFSAAVLSTAEGLEGVGGIANVAAATGLATRNGGAIPMVYGVTVTPTPGITGQGDVGVDGRLISDGDVHARIRLQIVGAGSTTISFGAVLANAEGAAYADGVLQDSEVATFTFSASGSTEAVPDRVSDAMEPIPDPVSDATEPVTDPVSHATEAVRDPASDATGAFSNRVSVSTGAFSSRVSGPTQAIPEPSAAIVFGAGLLTVAWIHRRD